MIFNSKHLHIIKYLLMTLSVIIFFAFLSLIFHFSSKNSQVNQEEIDLFVDGGDFTENLSIFFTINKNADTQIALFVKNNDAYLFLPSFANPAEVKYLNSNNIYQVYLDEKPLKNSEKINITPGDSSHFLTINATNPVNAHSKSRTYAFHICQSSNLNTMYISTASGTLSNINSDKEIFESGEYLYFDQSGQCTNAGSINKINARGQASFEYNKKSYKLKLDRSVNFLGHGKHKSWILQSNYFDRTRMRNALSYQLSTAFGVDYVVNYQYIDLYINNLYYGNYLLMDPIEIGKNRIDVKDEILFELMHKSDRLSIDSTSYYDEINNVYWEVRDPKNLDISIYDKAWENISKANLLVSNLSPTDSLEQLSDYIDLDSFASMYLTDFMLNDVDGARISTFARYDRTNNLLYAGPVWDYDKTLGAVINKSSPAECLTIYHDSWTQKLIKNAEFKKLVIKILNDNRTEIENIINSGITNIDSSINQSLQLELFRWDEVLNQAKDFGSYEANLDYLSQYMQARYILLNDLLYHPDDYVNIYFLDPNGRFATIKKGESLDEGTIEDAIYFAKKFDKTTIDHFTLPDNTLLDKGHKFYEDTVLKSIPTP